MNNSTPRSIKPGQSKAHKFEVQSSKKSQVSSEHKLNIGQKQISEAKSSYKHIIAKNKL